MSQPEPSTLIDPAAELVEVGSYPTLVHGSERGLVVLAMGLPYWLVEAAGNWSLRVEPAAAAGVREQLRRFERESLHWPPAPMTNPRPVARGAFFDALLWAWLLLGCVAAQQRWPALVPLGAVEPARIFRDGELWRPASALLLHADPQHVLHNLLAGLLVVTATITTFGRLRGWLLLPGAGVAGNFVTAALRWNESYRSLGASTAVFAGIGLLTGNAIRLAARTTHPHRWRTMFVPFGAGATALALYGAGGLDVDVLAHICGFVSGLVAGFFIGAPRGAP